MIPKSTEIRFETINKCNYNCQICMIKSLTRKRETMDYRLFKYLLDRVLSETDQYKNVSFAGIGEPLLDPSIISKVRYVKSKGLNPLIVTNGSLLTPDKFIELQDAGLYSVRISFHGASPFKYAALHGVPPINFYNIRDQITKISAMRNGVKLLLTCVYVKGINDESIEHWINLWEGKVDLMEIWRAHNWVNGLKNRIVQDKKLKTCGRLFIGPLQIQVDGTVIVCCFDYDGKTVLGDLKTQTLEEIFSSPMYQKIKKHHTSGDYYNSNLICEHCSQRNTDKNDVCLYSSKYDIKERVKLTSTVYEKVI